MKTTTMMMTTMGPTTIMTTMTTMGPMKTRRIMTMGPEMMTTMTRDLEKMMMMIQTLGVVMLMMLIQTLGMLMMIMVSLKSNQNPSYNQKSNQRGCSSKRVPNVYQFQGEYDHYIWGRSHIYFYNK